MGNTWLSGQERKGGKNLGAARIPAHARHRTNFTNLGKIVCIPFFIFANGLLGWVALLFNVTLVLYIIFLAF